MLPEHKSLTQTLPVSVCGGQSTAGHTAALHEKAESIKSLCCYGDLTQLLKSSDLHNSAGSVTFQGDLIFAISNSGKPYVECVPMSLC